MKRLLYLSLGFFLACVVVWAQASTAQIHGVVQDSSGAAVPGAEVKAIQTETDVSRTVTSAADGGYVLTNLPVGPYRLEIAKDCFTKYAQSGIELQVNSPRAWASLGTRRAAAKRRCEAPSPTATLSCRG